MVDCHCARVVFTAFERASQSTQCTHFHNGTDATILTSTAELEPQSFRYLLVLDFEAVCDEVTRPKPQEIIEFPTVVLDTTTLEIVGSFHKYVRPVSHPILTPFCTTLTGITQDMVSGQATFQEVFDEHLAWIQSFWKSLPPAANADADAASTASSSIPSEAPTWAFVTCGDWDLNRALPDQLAALGKKSPAPYRQWINIKKEFAVKYGVSPPGMTAMLDMLRLDLVGRHHSGIDDCRNIAAVAKEMLRDGHVFEITGTRGESKGSKASC
ncbi:hypothetical protein CAOG_003661 [Capsaspora owczarzaki ATCC 30864]|uniref:Exonuclease domain-containing protein n=1 Tax=Capsaspora owczarzaki (strain ATCC 30864) TaxID=595528 RepID=A0A0D2WPS8_CAPO3|nr:hypothetical protein CAOG_003661 [Capsaspora owczarzaki ATCC 30864]